MLALVKFPLDEIDVILASAGGFVKSSGALSPYLLFRIWFFVSTINFSKSLPVLIPRPANLP